jgi:hypothetical protein
LNAPDRHNPSIAANAVQLVGQRRQKSFGKNRKRPPKPDYICLRGYLPYEERRTTNKYGDTIMNKRSVDFTDKVYGYITDLADKKGIKFAEAFREVIELGIERHTVLERLAEADARSREIVSMLASHKRYVEMYFEEMNPESHRKVKTTMKTAAIKNRTEKRGK